ncbi:unnamed protein product [Schistosoma haematobium]|nr:unnamed protein product [Schistosoma haematobium]
MRPLWDTEDCNHIFIIISYSKGVQLIRRDQTSPIISGNFEKLITEKEIDLKFSFTFNGGAIRKLNIEDLRRITLRTEKHYAEITNYIFGYGGCETEILDKEEYFAVRRSCPTNIDNKSDTIKVMHVIHSNGKISLYYENIPRGIENGEVQTAFDYYIKCGQDFKVHNIIVTYEWINSRTLVEYEVLGDCLNHNSSETCQSGATLNTRCIWCEKPHLCITINDEDVHVFEVNGCQIKVSNW